MKDLKKARLAILLSIFIILSIASVYAFGANDGTESPGPAPDSGDGIPSGNQFIRPDAPGSGPAPNSGDGFPDGSGL